MNSANIDALATTPVIYFSSKRHKGRERARFIPVRWFRNERRHRRIKVREIISLSLETSPSSKISNAKNGEGEERWRDIIYEGRRHIAAQRFHRKARARAVDTPVYYVLAAFIQQKRAFRRRNCKFNFLQTSNPFPSLPQPLLFKKRNYFIARRGTFSKIFLFQRTRLIFIFFFFCYLDILIFRNLIFEVFQFANKFDYEFLWIYFSFSSLSFSLVSSNESSNHLQLINDSINFATIFVCCF